MSALQPIPLNDTNSPATELFAAIRQQLGVVPNIFRTVGHSPATLRGFLDFSGALADGQLAPALREQIALACAGANGCDYCASAHTALGKGAGLDDAELARNLRAEASDPQAAVVLRFVHDVVEHRARLNGAAAVEQLSAAGLSEGEIVEIIGHIALNLFTNYFNHIADTKIDFPHVDSQLAAAA